MAECIAWRSLGHFRLTGLTSSSHVGGRVGRGWQRSLGPGAIPPTALGGDIELYLLLSPRAFQKIENFESRGHQAIRARHRRIEEALNSPWVTYY